MKKYKKQKKNFLKFLKKRGNNEKKKCSNMDNNSEQS